jgi:hypothetical protein
MGAKANEQTAVKTAKVVWIVLAIISPLPLECSGITNHGERGEHRDV